MAMRLHQDRAAGLALSALAGLISGHSGDEQALNLSIERQGDQMVATLTSATDGPVLVRYTLTVSGGSATRHSGKTVVRQAGQRLSVVRFAARGPWRVDVDVQEGHGASYALSRSDRDMR